MTSTRRFLALYGYTREEVIGHTALELRLWPHPEERSVMMAELREHGGVQQYEAALRTKSGEIGQVLISVERLLLAGRPCIMGMLIDITLRKEYEAEIRK